MTISAPRKLLREFGWLCNRRGKSASRVLREFMAEFVDSRWAELEASSAQSESLRIFGCETPAKQVDASCILAVGSRPRGGDP